MNATTEQYTGWEITTGFLDGNLGEFADRAGSYAGYLRAAIEAAFPGATVRVDFQRGSGSTPLPYRTHVYDAAGKDHYSLADSVDRIAETVVFNGGWND